MIKGGVPDGNADYIHRNNIEKNILRMIIADPRKPILIHGTIGCGKSSIVSRLIHTGDLFPDRFRSKFSSINESLPIDD